MKRHDRGDSLPWLWLAALLMVFVAGSYVEHRWPEHPDGRDERPYGETP